MRGSWQSHHASRYQHQQRKKPFVRKTRANDRSGKVTLKDKPVRETQKQAHLARTPKSVSCHDDLRSTGSKRTGKVVLVACLIVIVLGAEFMPVLMMCLNNPSTGFGGQSDSSRASGRPHKGRASRSQPVDVQAKNGTSSAYAPFSDLNAPHTVSPITHPTCTDIQFPFQADMSGTSFSQMCGIIDQVHGFFSSLGPKGNLTRNETIQIRLGNACVAGLTSDNAQASYGFDSQPSSITFAPSINYQAPLQHSLQIVAHEWGHLFAGHKHLPAIAEHISDVFASLASIHFNHTDNPFRIAGDICLSPPCDYVRDLQLGHPAHMSEFDYAMDPHQTSHIPSRAYAIMVEYLGPDTVGQLYYCAITEGIPNQNFSFLRENLVAAAVDKFGIMSPEVAVVHDAFDQVGISPAGPNDYVLL